MFDINWWLEKYTKSLILFVGKNQNFLELREAVTLIFFSLSDKQNIHTQLVMNSITAV